MRFSAAISCIFQIQTAACKSSTTYPQEVFMLLPSSVCSTEFATSSLHLFNGGLLTINAVGHHFVTLLRTWQIEHY